MSVWLEFAIQRKSEDFIHVLDSERKSARCPYCHKPVVPKIGKIKAPHWAHKGVSCAPLKRNGVQTYATIPLYNDFTLNLSSNERIALHALWKEFQDREFVKKHHRGDQSSRFYRSALGCLYKNTHIKQRYQTLQRLVKKGCLQKKYHEVFNFSHTFEDYFRVLPYGQIPLGVLSLRQFWIEQHIHIQRRFDFFDHQLWPADENNTAVIDAKIFKRSYERLQQQRLYWIEIYDEGTLKAYKIGVTNNFARRKEEILRVLQNGYMTHPRIELIYLMEMAASVERYILYKYAEDRITYGSMSEFFKPDGINLGILHQELNELADSCS